MKRTVTARQVVFELAPYASWRDDHLVQQLDTSYYCFDSKLLTIQVNNVLKLNLLALAGSDNKVHIFHLTSDNQLAHLLDLTGYDDWVKCLDSLTLETRDSELLLATASQDCLVRVCHINIVSLEIRAPKFMANDTINKGSLPIYDLMYDCSVDSCALLMYIFNDHLAI